MTEKDEAFEDLAKRQGDWGMQGSRKHQIMRYAENVENKGTSMTDKEAMAMALEALECANSPNGDYENEIAALKEQLAQPHETTLKEFNQLIHDDPKYHIWAKEKALQTLHNENERLGLYRDAYAEPVALVIDGVLVKSELPEKYTGHLFTTPPPQRPWVGLTDEDISEIVRGTHNTGSFVRAIEQALKEKNQ